MAKKKEMKVMQHILASIGFGLLFFFLIANILFSQRIPDLYFEIIHEDQHSMVDFLKRGYEDESFQLLLPEIQHIFSTHEQEVYAEELQRRELIQKLERLKEQNPKSRDILYSLHLLYEKAGNEDKAYQYLLQAQEIDPSVGK